MEIMKTITELMDDAKVLERKANELFQELAEFKEAERHRDDVPDILKWMEYADRHPLTGHGLVGRKDITVALAYLSLLFSVAMYQISSTEKISPLVHPCRIAVALKDKINPEKVFKESLFMDEITIRKYSETVLEADLDSLFILDALIMTGRYEDKNHSKLEYIADLAAIMEISQSKMNEIILAAKAIVEESEFIGKLLEVPFYDFIYYLDSCPTRIVETPSKFMAVSDEPFIWTPSLDSKFDFNGCEEVSFDNIQFLSRNTQYNFTDIDILSFNCCTFSGFENGVFEANNVLTIDISYCIFRECTAWQRGIIGALENVESLSVNNAKFVDCGDKYGTTRHRLFSGISRKKIFADRESIDRINSCPIC